MSAAAPFPLTVIKGDHVTLAAPQTAEVGDVACDFENWSDEGARVHSLVATEAKTYVFRVFVEATGDGSLPSTAVVFRWRVVEGKP